MNQKRRNFLSQIGQLAIAAPIGLIASSGFKQTNSPPSPPFPGDSSNEQNPNPDNSPKPDPMAALKRNQQHIKDDVEKLFTLAEKPKEQVEKTDSTNVLSLPLIESTKQIESLAKQIRNLAVG